MNMHRVCVNMCTFTALLPSHTNIQEKHALRDCVALEKKPMIKKRNLLTRASSWQTDSSLVQQLQSNSTHTGEETGKMRDKQTSEHFSSDYYCRKAVLKDEPQPKSIVWIVWKVSTPTAEKILLIVSQQRHCQNVFYCYSCESNFSFSFIRYIWALMSKLLSFKIIHLLKFLN